MTPPRGSRASDRARFFVRLTPRAGTDAVDGVGPSGELRVRVRAAPVEGAANRAMLRLLAHEVRVPLASLAIESGEGSRMKRLSADDAAAERLLARYPELNLGSADPS